MPLVRIKRTVAHCHLYEGLKLQQPECLLLHAVTELMSEFLVSADSATRLCAMLLSSFTVVSCITTCGLLIILLSLLIVFLGILAAKSSRSMMVSSSMPVNAT